MKYLLGVLLAIANFHVLADCKASLPLEGVVSVKVCDPGTKKCISGAQAVYDYMGKVKDDPAILTIALHASPWHFYDSEMRILGVEEVAELVRPLLKPGVKRVALIASWTGVAPAPGQKSLAQRLSEELKGFPVDGKDGFLWLSKRGAMRTTRQALTLTQGRRPYGVVEGDEVMVSLVAGWSATMEEVFVEERDAERLMRAGAGWDIFFLCPDRALQAFEAAAKLSHPIAAYNAALVRLDRGHPGDLDAAIALASQAADSGDKKAKALLARLKVSP